MKQTAFWSALGVVTLLVSGCGTARDKMPWRHHVDDHQGSDSSLGEDSHFSLLHSPHGWEKEPVEIFANDNFNEAQIATIKKVLDRYNEFLGRNLLVFAGVEHAETGDDLFSSLDDNRFFLYLREDWFNTKKDYWTLATTIWDNVKEDQKKMATADIHFNAEAYALVDTLAIRPDEEEQIEREGKEVVDFESLFIHELGHALGLTHVPTKLDEKSVMNPTIFIGIGEAKRDFSELDIANLRFIYDGTPIPLELSNRGTAYQSAF